MNVLRTTLIGAATLLAAASSDTALAVESLGPLQSPVYEAKGSQRELAVAARACAVKVLGDSSAEIRDASGANVLGQAAPVTGDDARSSGSQLIATYDADSGLVVVQARLTRAALMSRDTIQSSVTIETKDDRFRITHSSIARASASLVPGGKLSFVPVYIQMGSGHAKVRELLERLSDAIAACMKDAPAADNW